MRTPEEIRKHGVELSTMAGDAGEDSGPEECLAIATMGILSMLTEIAAQLAEMNAKAEGRQ